MAQWKVLRKVFHRGQFMHPGQVTEESDRFDGRPNMELVADDAVSAEPVKEPEPEPKPEILPVAELDANAPADGNKGAA